MRSGGFVDGGSGFALWNKGRIEERANLVERDAERDVFNQSGANDIGVGCGKFGNHETAGWTLLRQNLAEGLANGHPERPRVGGGKK